MNFLWKKLKTLRGRRKNLDPSFSGRCTEVMITSVSSFDDQLKEQPKHVTVNGCPLSPSDNPGPSTAAEKIIYDADGVIVSGAADALLCQMLPTCNYCPSSETAFALLLSLRAFVSPGDLLQKVLQHCMFEQNLKSENFRKESRSRLFEHMLFFCREWTTSIPYDFVDSAMRDRLLEIFGLCVTDSAAQRKCDQLMFALKATLNKLERYEVAINSLHQNVEDPPATDEHLCGFAAACSDASSVAQQLSHIELERFSMIGVDELVTILKSGGVENFGTTYTASRKSNVKYYIDWFNQLTNLVATEVLRNSRKRHRVKTIEFFIDVAKECINIGNFNSMMAIVAGLSLQPIRRLKKTWSRVEKSKLEILQHQLDPSSNFVSYRATLKAAVWRVKSINEDAEHVIIPFFGLLMKDLFLIYQRCVTPLSNGHLDYSMFRQFAEHMRNVLTWKSRVCPFKKDSHILQYLLLAPNYSQINMSRLSYDYEMPDLLADKEEYKRIRECDKM